MFPKNVKKIFLHAFLFQEYIFRLEPGKVDSGKGKCPYDPKLNSVSALIRELIIFLLLFFMHKVIQNALKV